MKISERIAQFIDLLYIAPIRILIPHRTFRYAAAGGLNMGFNVVLYYILFHYVLFEQDTSILGIVVISAPILAFGIAFVVTFLSGFWLTRSLAFNESELRTHTQLFRYIQVVVVNVGVNYFGLKLLVDVWDLYPTPSYLSLQFVTVGISYMASKHYTFR